MKKEDEEFNEIMDTKDKKVLNNNKALKEATKSIESADKAIETVKSTVRKLVSPDKQKPITNMISGIENVIPSK